MEDQSKLTFKQMLSALLRSNRRHARYIQAFACLAVLVAVAVPLVMRQYGVAMTTTETRLACQYAGNGAHTHNADCYDAYGNLVCPLAEKPFHTHTADCYATERVLTCTLPETAGHAHTDACYDEDGNLTCTLPEEPAHTHSDACYETRTTDQLICGMEETTEEHVHGPACFETVTVELPDPEPEPEPTTTTPAEPETSVSATPEEDPTPAQEFTDVLKKKDENGNEYVYLVVQVKAPQGALPKGAAMSLAHVDLSKKDDLTGLTAQQKLDEVLRKEAGEEAAFVQTDAVDISFHDAEGNRVDPAKKVEVRITTANIRTFSDQRTAGDEAVANNNLLVLHVVDHQQTKRTDAPNAELIRKAYLVNQDEKDTSTGHEDTIVFEAQEFSPYIVARVNNAALAPEPEPEPEPEAEPTEAAEPAAEATLDLTAEDQPAEAQPADAPDMPAQSFSHRIADTNDNQLMRIDVLAPEGALPRGTTMQVAWVDSSHIQEAVSMAVAERTPGKLVDLRAVDIKFIDPDGHEIEPAEKIIVTFASDLIDTTDDSYVVHVDDEGKGEVVDALGAKELQKREMADQADELVIESDQFSTYAVAVTTPHREMKASDGATYDITVDVPAEAGVPEDAELLVSEIAEGDEGYEEYLSQALNALGEESSTTRLARFFNITIANNGEAVELQAPVRVDIQLADVESLGTQVRSNAVHFADGASSPEVLEANSNDVAVSFNTTSLSVYGVIYTADFHYGATGKIFDFDINGDGFVSLTHLVESLGITELDNPQELLGTIEGTDAEGAGVDAAAMARAFVANVDRVELSNPSMLWVGKVDSDSTVGAIKEGNGLDAQRYTENLNTKEIEGIDAQVVEGGDWAIISLRPFENEETLTITMNNGDQFEIRVTDAQPETFSLSNKGEQYEVIVTFNEKAEIPEGAELVVTEIAEDDDVYAEVQEKVDGGLEEGKENIPSHPLLLDIAIMYEGQEIEPAEGSWVNVEVKTNPDYLKGQYTDEDSPILVNEEPIKEEASDMSKEVQVLHMTNDDAVDVMETEDVITNTEVSSTFTTDSFSNWLVYLDEDLADITLSTGDSLTLRPYSEWHWKSDEDPYVIDGIKWVFPSGEYYTREGDREVSINYQGGKENRHGIVSASTQNGKYVFEGFAKYDLENKEDYWYYHISNLAEGDFDIHTSAGKVIHVHVRPNAHGDKPGTVEGISGLTVNLFDYDVPGYDNNYDFTKSNTLDERNNTGASPYNTSINTGHNFKFLGWGTSGENPASGWINGYTKDKAKQGIVEDHLQAVGTDTEKYPVLNYEGNENLKYLFNPTSKDHNVYAFPNADGLFQQDNQGFYYYNSNSNYAEYDRQNNRFVLYEHTYTQNTGGSGGANAKPIGFFPFHEYDTAETQPEMNFNKNLNHHFGMSMSVDFQIPKDRRAEFNNNKYDIIYEFSGDDDLWVFVDDELVLDIGGIHQPVRGTINFTTGEIIVYGEETVTKTFSVGAHTMKMFYLERGGCDSNLSVKFNLPLITGKAALDVAKMDDSSHFLPGAMFGVWETADCSGEPYLTAVSDASGYGHVDFGYLPIAEEGQKYYLKEIAPPAGYLLNTTVFTATAVADGENTYKFVITDSEGNRIETIPQEPSYPIIRDEEPEPISMSVYKQWQNYDGTEIPAPENMTAVFEVKRHYYYVEGSIGPENSIINVYRVDANWANPTLKETREYAGDSKAYVNWTYNYYYGWEKNGEYRINNDATSRYKGNGAAEITLTAGATTNVYIFDGNKGGQYDQFGVENITVTGTEPSGGGGNITTDEGEDTTYQGPTVTLPTAGGAWNDTVNNLPVVEQKNGRTYFYQYYFVEKTVPDGFEAVYLDGNGNPITDPSSQMTNHNGSQTVVNRKLIDVPIEKHWADTYIGDDYTWTATFQLQYSEEKVNESEPDAPDAKTDTFVDVEGRTLTISKGQDASFEDLPMYKVHSNGTTYRLIYSVDEIAYEVKDSQNHVVAKWTKAGGVEVGEAYAPQFEQDAGEHGDSIEDYKIFIVNSLDSVVPTRGITLDVTKTWQNADGIKDDDDAYAKFVLKRLVHEEYRDYSDVSDGTQWFDITLDTGSNKNEPQTLHVPAGTTMHIVGSIKAGINANKIVFTQSSGQDNLELAWDNMQSSDKYLFDITFTADQSKTISLYQGDNYVIGGREGFFLSDTYGGHTPDTADAGFAIEFTLNKANNWHEYIDYLPTMEERDVDPRQASQTIKIYSYYLEEVGSNPEGYVANFADSQGNLVDIHNAIDVSTEVTATNTGHFTNIEFGKDWKKPDGTEDETKATTPVTYTLFQISTDDSGAEAYHDLYLGTYRLTEDEDLQTATVDDPCSFTVTHTGKQTIYDLPTEGFVNGKHVTHKYYVLEEHIDGYTPDSPAAVDSGTYTITNTEVSPASETTDVTIEKKWEGTDAEAFGGIRVKLIQKKSELPKLPNDPAHYDFYPVTVVVRNGNESTSNATRIIRYVKAGSEFKITFNTKDVDKPGWIRYNNENPPIKPNQAPVTKTTEVWDDTTINIQTQPGHSWKTDWDYTIQTGDNVSGHANTLIDQIAAGRFDYQTTDASIFVDMPEKGVATVDGGAYTTTPVENAWKTTVNALPYYEKGADGKYYVYTYEIAEASIIDPDTHEEVEAVTQNEDGTGGKSAHFKVSYSTGVNGELVVTNTRKTDFQIIKVDSADMTNKTWRLEGALFWLQKIDPNSPSISYLDPNNPILPETTGVEHKTGTDGVALFKDLEDGYYEIWEKEIPKHYLITENEKFYIKVENYTVTLIERDAATGAWKESSGNELLVLAATQGTIPATATVGNVFGAELPKAGGPGTLLYTLCGLALFAAAGYVGLASKRSARKEVA